MASRAEIARLHQANTVLSDRAAKDLAKLWGTLDLTKPEQARDVLLRYLPALTDKYGTASATVAAEWYEALRAESVGGSFSPLLAEPVAEVAVTSRVRFGAQHLFTDNPQQTLAFLVNAVDGYVKQPGRDTVSLNVARDPAKPTWARVPKGAHTCRFCAMLASRGPVYSSRFDAGGDAHRFHGHCDCVATPFWRGDPLPDGYDPQELYRQYKADRSEAL